MQYKLLFSKEAKEKLESLETHDPKKYKKVCKILGYMETNLSHPSLQTHKYESLSGPEGQEVFEAYVENRTPGAWRIFWYYGPGRSVITVWAIAPHP
ncbi:hypothetical protein [Scytonema sp. PCC 10023]|uniref:hypothetical protein n=1 Tax=Scytonema sp. PCC 10023 TaxID=1680591 RepID=UPI0039C6CE72